MESRARGFPPGFSRAAQCPRADSVTAVELHPTLAQCARRNVAANCLGNVSVVERDAGLLERGKEVRRRGCNLVVVDFFDCGDHPAHITTCHVASLFCCSPASALAASRAAHSARSSSSAPPLPSASP
ncbi:hypothetical protein CYMTET_43897 [Cymbomonas tetramitiformis]|uniref:Uncharacterized protein n=1 Tax=Cymbomonas tetramitiformis TaxID=36881 RepID=A0AAE0C184_9CHLO|nr:hypothetical protein CYMTET_43897 [Cymbomonas tetramitiformis]